MHKVRDETPIATVVANNGLGNEIPFDRPAGSSWGGKSVPMKAVLKILHKSKVII